MKKIDDDTYQRFINLAQLVIILDHEDDPEYDLGGALIAAGFEPVYLNPIPYRKSLAETARAALKGLSPQHPAAEPQEPPEFPWGEFDNGDHWKGIF